MEVVVGVRVRASPGFATLVLCPRRVEDVFPLVEEAMNERLPGAWERRPVSGGYIGEGGPAAQALETLLGPFPEFVLHASGRSSTSAPMASDKEYRCAGMAPGSSEMKRRHFLMRLSPS